MIIPLALATSLAFAGTDPVSVATCDVSSPTLLQMGADINSMDYGGYTLHVTFADIAPETVSKVTFALNDGTQVSDVGTFSPNATIDHLLDIAPTEAQSCSVSAVHFTNGQEWTAQ